MFTLKPLLKLTVLLEIFTQAFSQKSEWIRPVELYYSGYIVRVDSRCKNEDCCPFVKCYNTFTTFTFPFELWKFMHLSVVHLNTGKIFFFCVAQIFQERNTATVMSYFVIPLFMLNCTLVRFFHLYLIANKIETYCSFYHLQRDMSSANMNTKKLLCRHNWIKNGKGIKLVCVLNGGNI